MARNRSILVVCSNEECDRVFRRKPSAIQSSGLTFCSHHCSAGYTNIHRINPMSIRRNARIQQQPKCRNPLCDNRLPLERFTFCSIKCRVECAQENDKVFVVEKIRNFVSKSGRIPVKYELPGLYSKARMGYGTWNKAIEAAGYDPNPVMFAKHYLAKDGHKCDSMAEKIVDDWLYAKKIGHNVHVAYPWHNGMKCDFLVGDTWIEIFGLEGNVTRYDELKKEKLILVEQFKLKLLCLSLKDVYSKSMLRVRLSRFCKMEKVSRLLDNI